MKIKVILLLLVALMPTITQAKIYNVSSPDKSITIQADADKALCWSVKYGSTIILAKSDIALDTSRGVLGKDKIVSSTENSVDEVIYPVVCEKRNEIRDHYNSLLLKTDAGYSIEFRAYDNGAAYRFITDFDGELIVNSETCDLNFDIDHKFYFPEEKSFITHYEQLYKYCDISSVKAGQICSLPFLVDYGNGLKMAFAESGLLDYPGIYFTGTEKSALKANIPGYVLEYTMRNDRDSKIEKRADYIAKTSGRRSFPWRILTITKNDADLFNSQLVYLLAEPCKLSDTSWIQPGKVAWDWYNDNNIFGVDFKAGVNTETYKYFIDFASEYGIEYIILDEGWYKLGNALDIADNMDIEELFAYAKKKNVGIILWLIWKTLDNDLDAALKQYKMWGCKGLKVDFMQRDDQEMVRLYEKLAAAAAKYEMLIDFHGSYKPSGLRRAYPNLITREGVKGSENNKWSDIITPEHNTTLPFIRMMAGPMDYTPGCMVNASEKDFKSRFTRPMSLGTRCQQLAMYVVFESPLQMLCDSPSQYLREKECMEFLAPVPTVWDETVVQDASVGNYILLARKNGNEWYAGAMTDWDAREMTLDCSFLGDGKYKAVIYQDGINADRYASDYKKVEKVVTGKDKMSVKMAAGGGWVARFVPVK